MEELLSGAVQHLFSIVVAVWLLVRMEQRLDGLTVAIRELCTALCDVKHRPSMTIAPTEHRLD